MNMRARLTSRLYHEVLEDLHRPHDFAAERIGFLFAKMGNKNDPSGLIVNFTQYIPVEESSYINDPRVGAMINSGAIRSTMQHCITTNQGAFHVHMHEHEGRPGFSRTDLREQPKLIPSFQAVKPSEAHGMILFSKNELVGMAWRPGAEYPENFGRISIVGFPMRFFYGESK